MKYIFVDGSYYIFLRYHALTNWYNMAHPEELAEKQIATGNSKDKICMTRDHPNFGMFCEKFKRLFVEHLEKTIKKYRSNKKDVNDFRILIASDCSKKSIWRFEMSPSYKEGRKCDDIVKDFFTIAHSEIYPTLTSDGILGCPVYTVGVESVEADDILAVAHQTIRGANQEDPIIIITNDHDYYQLVDDHTIIDNLRGKPVTSEKINKIYELVRKIITGDKSDNIPPVMPAAKKFADQMILEMEKSKEIEYDKTFHDLITKKFKKDDAIAKAKAQFEKIKR